MNEELSDGIKKLFTAQTADPEKIKATVDDVLQRRLGPNEGIVVDDPTVEEVIGVLSGEPVEREVVTPEEEIAQLVEELAGLGVKVSTAPQGPRQIVCSKCSRAGGTLVKDKETGTYVCQLSCDVQRLTKMIKAVRNLQRKSKRRLQYR